MLNAFVIVVVVIMLGIFGHGAYVLWYAWSERYQWIAASTLSPNVDRKASGVFISARNLFTACFESCPAPGMTIPEAVCFWIAKHTNQIIIEV